MSKKKSSKKHKDNTPKPEETEAVVETPVEQEPAVVEEPVVAEEDVAVEENPPVKAEAVEVEEAAVEEPAPEEAPEGKKKSSKKKRKGGKAAEEETTQEAAVSEEPEAASSTDGVEVSEGKTEVVAEANSEAPASEEEFIEETVAEVSEEDLEAVLGDAPPAPADTDTGLSLKMVVEAILFASQKPVSGKEIVSVLKGAADANKENPSSPALAFGKIKEPAIQAVIEQLENDCADPARAYEVRETAAGWQLVTKPGYSPWLRQIYPENRPARLSAPALETLAIIAYRQPITRADIEAVRGVAVDGVMQTLLDRGLVKIAGRADIPGRPLLYDTTQHFMEHFGLKNLDDLPNAGELRKIALPKAEIPEETAKPAAAQPTAPAGESTPTEPAPEQSDATPSAETAAEQAGPSADSSSEPATEDATPEPSEHGNADVEAPEINDESEPTEEEPAPIEQEEPSEQPDSTIASEPQPAEASAEVEEFTDVPETPEPVEEFDSTETVEAVETLESPESAETYEAAEISDTPETDDPSRSENS